MTPIEYMNMQTSNFRAHFLVTLSVCLFVICMVVSVGWVMAGRVVASCGEKVLFYAVSLIFDSLSFLTCLGYYGRADSLGMPAFLKSGATPAELKSLYPLPCAMLPGEKGVLINPYVENNPYGPLRWPLQINQVINPHASLNVNQQKIVSLQGQYLYILAGIWVLSNPIFMVSVSRFLFKCCKSERKDKRHNEEKYNNLIGEIVKYLHQIGVDVRSSDTELTLDDASLIAGLSGLLISGSCPQDVGKKPLLDNTITLLKDMQDFHEENRDEVTFLLMDNSVKIQVFSQDNTRDQVVTSEHTNFDLSTVLNTDAFEPIAPGSRLDKEKWRGDVIRRGVVSLVDSYVDHEKSGKITDTLNEFEKRFNCIKEAYTPLTIMTPTVG